MRNRNKYMLDRYYAKRARAIEYLGGQCINCGGTNELEIDHIDPATKELEISGRANLSWDRWLVELAKCQLLCKPCHKIKSDGEKSVEHGGGKSGKRNCPCQLCRDRKKEYMRKWKRDRKALLV